MSVDAAIHVRGLARTFKSPGRGGPVQAVRGIDLDVEAGQIVGFLGPNGAGKTTTIRMLATLLTPTAGTARVAGFDVVSERHEVRSRIGYIGQAGGAGPEHRVLDELRTQAELYGMSRAEAAVRAGHLIEEFGLTGLETRTVKTLSGGQRRRLDVAMGLVHRPSVIFLDEPTAGLDPQSRARVWEHLRELQSTDGATIFLTTHHLDEADSLCDRIVVVDGGEVIASDRPETLKAKVAGDVVTLKTDQLTDAVRVLTGIVPDSQPDTAPGVVTVYLTEAPRVLPDVLRGLDAAGVTLQSISVEQPSLEDVFLRLTGRGLREDNEPAPADALATSDAV